MEYEDMTVAQLKELLREADLPVSGNKSVLIERLTQNHESLESNVDDSVQEESDDFDDTFDDEDDFFDEDDWDEIYESVRANQWGTMSRSNFTKLLQRHGKTIFGKCWKYLVNSIWTIPRK